MKQNKNIMAAEAYQILGGPWRLSRTVMGYESQYMFGEAKFIEAEPSVLVYEETGKHRLHGGEELDFYQRYIYRYEKESLFAYFEDRRLFHELEFCRKDGILKAEGRHVCGADTYEGEYIFKNKDNFSLCWGIKGPKKNYRIKTDFIRQGTC